MDDARTAAIRARAYALWVAEGKPEGRAEEHWKRAEQEHDAEEAPRVGDVSDPAASLGSKPPADVPEPKF